jgi:hypothetical protein
VEVRRATAEFKRLANLARRSSYSDQMINDRLRFRIGRPEV